MLFLSQTSRVVRHASSFKKKFQCWSKHRKWTFLYFTGACRETGRFLGGIWQCVASTLACAYLFTKECHIQGWWDVYKNSCARVVTVFSLIPVKIWAKLKPSEVHERTNKLCCVHTPLQFNKYLFVWKTMKTISELKDYELRKCSGSQAK